MQYLRLNNTITNTISRFETVQHKSQCFNIVSLPSNSSHSSDSISRADLSSKPHSIYRHPSIHPPAFKNSPHRVSTGGEERQKSPSEIKGDRRNSQARWKKKKKRRRKRWRRKNVGLSPWMAISKSRSRGSRSRESIVARRYVTRESNAVFMNGWICSSGCERGASATGVFVETMKRRATSQPTLCGSRHSVPIRERLEEIGTPRRQYINRGKGEREQRGLVARASV